MICNTDGCGTSAVCGYKNFIPILLDLILVSVFIIPKCDPFRDKRIGVESTHLFEL